jgi:hypothetical protein
MKRALSKVRINSNKELINLIKIQFRWEAMDFLTKIKILIKMGLNRLTYSNMKPEFSKYEATKLALSRRLYV